MTLNSMRTAMKPLSLLLALAIFAGCAQERLDKDTKNKVDVLTASEDKLVQAGERLVDPVNFPLAMSMFDAALAANPHNKKAQFYKAMLAPYMHYKGFLNRIRPLFKAEGREMDLDSFIRQNQLITRVNSPLRDFLMAREGSAIRNYHEVQTFFLEQQKSWDKLRLWAKENREVQLSLGMNPYVWRQQLEQRTQEYCDVSSDGTSYFMNCPENFAEVQIAAPDMMALQQSAAGMVLYFNFMTSYSMENSEKAREIVNLGGPQSVVTEKVRALPGFMTLRRDSQITLIDDLGVDLVSGVRWMMANQHMLCPNGVHDPKNRRGHLFQGDACLVSPVSEVNETLSMIEKVLMGQTIRVPHKNERTGVEGSINVNYGVIWRAPLKDLKRHMPLEYNQCGQGVKFADNYLEGILPDGNLLDVTDTACP